VVLAPQQRDGNPGPRETDCLGAVNGKQNTDGPRAPGPNGRIFDVRPTLIASD